MKVPCNTNYAARKGFLWELIVISLDQAHFISEIVSSIVTANSQHLNVKRVTQHSTESRGFSSGILVSPHHRQWHVYMLPCMGNVAPN